MINHTRILLREILKFDEVTEIYYLIVCLDFQLS